MDHVKQKCFASRSTMENAKDHAINRIGAPSVSSLVTMVESTSILLSFRVYPDVKLDGFSGAGSTHS